MCWGKRGGGPLELRARALRVQRSRLDGSSSAAATLRLIDARVDGLIPPIRPHPSLAQASRNGGRVTRSSYRTVSKSSNVDESLFGSQRPKAGTGKAQVRSLARRSTRRALARRRSTRAAAARHSRARTTRAARQPWLWDRQDGADPTHPPARFGFGKSFDPDGGKKRKARSARV